MQATNIDQVLQRLAAVIEDAKARDSRLGFFAALYRQVTLEVQLDAEIMPTAKSVNIIAEMPGSDARLADQVVMCGATFAR